MPPITPDQATEKLAGYPQDIIEQYEAFFVSRDPDKLDAIIFALLTFLMPEPPAQPLAECPPEFRLREDLDIDSITISEAVFIIEDLFDISISNEALMQMSTLQDLRNYLRAAVVP